MRAIASRREKSATKTILLMTLAFFVCWLPYAVLCLFSMAGGQGPASIFVLPILFAKSSIVWNPLLYIFCNDEVSES